MKNNYNRIIFCVMLASLAACTSMAQLFDTEKEFTRADTLRGTLSPERTCFDVNYYQLDLRIDTINQSINGSNKIYFRVVQHTNRIQLDLFRNMSIHKVVLDDTLETEIIREEDAFFVLLKDSLHRGTKHTLQVHFGGKPLVGRMLPWDGGFKWTTDRDGNAWIVVACQGTGASLWWPNKDHQSDEPDSMLISVSVPSNLINVSNGRLRNKKELRGGYTRFDWFVSSPINNYSVTLNIGNYTHFSDVYVTGKDTLTLDYFVLPHNLEKARKQFEQVKPMLSCYERYFGRYPFYKDGYKLVETPYLGMEHQSCIAYGNKFLNGYSGFDYSGAGIKFDYIIIHESAHEWWGNAITTKDIADMWVHEGFASYAEVLYTECMYDSAKAGEYVIGQFKKIGNRKPIIGPYGVNTEGSGDMYPKGLALLHTLRHVISNDSVWFGILKGLQDQFRYQTVTSSQIESYISKQAGRNLDRVFDQYLRATMKPALEVRQASSGEAGSLEYRWVNINDGFDMPVYAFPEKNQTIVINPTIQWQKMVSGQSPENTFKNVDRLFYIDLKVH